MNALFNSFSLPGREGKESFKLQVKTSFFPFPLHVLSSIHFSLLTLSLTKALITCQSEPLKPQCTDYRICLSVLSCSITDFGTTSLFQVVRFLNFS